MRVPISWLKEFVMLDASAEEIADRFTFSGLEVEGIETFGGECRGVIAARILGTAPHPNATNLVLCDIDAGSGPCRVVCGARNFKPGDMVPYAPVGATLANGTRIEKAVIRGQESPGMLCAEDELGISDDHVGLMILPADAKPGAPLSSVIGPPEKVLVIEVTPNRPDCLSIKGIAREAAALFGVKMSIPQVNLIETDTPVETMISVAVKDKIGCPRYTARALTGIKIGPSPLLIRMRLIQCGIRPINNVVDVTNYVLLEYGQPLHAFDKRMIGGGKIVVRRAKQGETMATLDGVERKITPEMLVIADDSRPLALAGVMGGAGSEISGDTTEVLLESACFQPSLIRKTSKTAGLSTESSYRFERGVDPELAEAASRRAAELMILHAGAFAARGCIDIRVRNPKPRTIRCRFDRVRSLIGVDAPNARIMEIFEALDLKIGRSTASACTVIIPSFRPDLEIEADLAEEFSRIYGLDKIPARAPRGSCVPGADDSATQAVIHCRNTLAGLGLTETMNYSFVAPKLLDMFDSSGASARVILPNPVNADQSALRPSLAPQMVQSLGLNMTRQTTEAALFETGRVYFKDGSGKLCEEERVAIGLMGPLGRSWQQKRKQVDADEVFLWLKGVIESLCAAMKLGKAELKIA